MPFVEGWVALRNLTDRGSPWLFFIDCKSPVTFIDESKLWEISFCTWFCIWFYLAIFFKLSFQDIHFFLNFEICNDLIISIFVDIIYYGGAFKWWCREQKAILLSSKISVAWTSKIYDLLALQTVWQSFVKYLIGTNWLSPAERWIIFDNDQCPTRIFRFPNFLWGKISLVYFTQHDGSWHKSG